MFLIADDSPGKVMMLQVLLKKAKWSTPIVVARTTEEAEELIDAHPDISHAFIDYYIPSQYGPSIISYLKTKNPSARIALVSSADNPSNDEEAKAAGAGACICVTRGTSDEVEKVILELLEEWKNP